MSIDFFLEASTRKKDVVFICHPASEVGSRSWRCVAGVHLRGFIQVWTLFQGLLSLSQRIHLYEHLHDYECLDSNPSSLFFPRLLSQPCSTTTEAWNLLGRSLLPCHRWMFVKRHAKGQVSWLEDVFLFYFASLSSSKQANLSKHARKLIQASLFPPPCEAELALPRFSHILTWDSKPLSCASQT